MVRGGKVYPTIFGEESLTLNEMDFNLQTGLSMQSRQSGKVDIRVGYTRKLKRARGLVRIRRQPPKL